MYLLALLKCGAHNTTSLDRHGRALAHLICMRDDWPQEIYESLIRELCGPEPWDRLSPAEKASKQQLLGVKDAFGAYPADYRFIVHNEGRHSAHLITSPFPLFTHYREDILGVGWMELFMMMADQRPAQEVAIRLATLEASDASALQVLVKKRDVFGNSLLLVAATMNMISRGLYTAIVQLLLRLGADPDARGYGMQLCRAEMIERSALNVAVLGSSVGVFEPVQVVDALLQHGADPNQLQPHRLSELHAAGSSPIIFAACSLLDIGHNGGVLRLLLKAGADPNAVNSGGVSVLMKIVRSLVDKCKVPAGNNESIVRCEQAVAAVVEAGGRLSDIGPAFENETESHFRLSSPAALIVRAAVDKQYRISADLASSCAVVVDQQLEEAKQAAAGFTALGGYLPNNSAAAGGDEVRRLRGLADMSLSVGALSSHSYHHGTFYRDVRLGDGVLVFYPDFERTHLAALAPLYLHLARFHPPPISSSYATRCHFGHTWVAALIGCIVSAGWEPLAQLLPELFRQVEAVTTVDKILSLEIAVWPLGAYFLRLGVSGDITAAGAATATLLSSPLLSRDRGRLSDWLLVSCADSALFDAVYSAGGSKRGLSNPNPRPLPLPLAAYMCSRAAVRMMLNKGADTGSEQQLYFPLLIGGLRMYLRDEYEMVTPLDAVIRGCLRGVGADDYPGVEEWCGLIDDLVAAGADVNGYASERYPQLVEAMSVASVDDDAERPAMVSLTSLCLIQLRRHYPLLADGSEAAALQASPLFTLTRQLVGRHRAELPPALLGGCDLIAKDIAGEDDEDGFIDDETAYLTARPTWAGHGRAVVAALRAEAEWARRKHWIGLREVLRDRET